MVRVAAPSGRIIGTSVVEAFDCYEVDAPVATDVLGPDVRLDHFEDANALAIRFLCHAPCDTGDVHECA